MTTNNTRPDDLTAQSRPDRLNYATGMLLAEDDFLAEQTYHRGRLAQALAYLHGSGTVAGLRVAYQPEVPPAGDGTGGQVETLTIEPGLAIDRLGRLIELRDARCIRLANWYNQQPPDQLKLAQHAGFALRVEDGGGLVDVTLDGVVVDVFLRFVACERGKTPAFASGPLDATAVQPARVRDSAEIRLVLRTEPDPPLPKNLWADLENIPEADKRQVLLHAHIFGAWDHDDASDPDNPEPPGEHAIGEDPSAVFLARIVIPASEPLGSERPPRGADSVRLDNHSRLFAYTTRALAKRIGL